MYYFILNPNARSHKSSRTWPYIRQVMIERKLAYKACPTKYPGHAKEIAETISKTDPTATIVVVGGDGTIHEVLNGLTNLSTITFGVIPSGSGNDFAAGMGISRNLEKAINAILEPRTIRKMDVGVVTRAGERERFGVSCGIGFDAAVCQEANQSAIKRLLNRIGAGSLSYAAIAVRQIALFSPRDMEIELEGGRRFRYKHVYFVSVMNQRYEGGGLMLTPKAKADDGILDVFVCAGISRKVIVTCLPTAKFGAHVHIPGLHFLRCRSVTIRSGSHNAIHLDGESGGIHTSLTAGIEAEKLSVIVE